MEIEFFYSLAFEKKRLQWTLENIGRFVAKGYDPWTFCHFPKSADSKKGSLESVLAAAEKEFDEK